jgi:hypothetical protein
MGLGGGGLGGSSLGGGNPPFAVESAIALSHTSVRVRFTDLIDFTFGPILNAANYTISPGLVVNSVAQESAQTVVLGTAPQAAGVYTVSVQQGKSLNGQLLDINNNEATFNGISTTPSFFAVATSPTRVRAVFDVPMLNDSNLSNPANYTLTDLAGTSVTVLSATPEQATHPLSVILILGSALHDEAFYQLTVSASVKTETNESVSPASSAFQWVSGVGTVAIPIDAFSGEVQGGLYGLHAGLVFFSPALITPIGNSIIQVDEVDVCTRAYDTYTPPQPIDPPTLYTFGGAVHTTIGATSVLWAPFPRNFEAKFDLGFSPQLTVDVVPPADDTSCSVVLRQPFDPSQVALLNDTAWYLFNNTGLVTPPVFITANNAAGPIPAGPNTIIVLHEHLVADSGMAVAKPTTRQAIAATLPGNSTVKATPT